MDITRIIHPIGQGAFYTESICIYDKVYNIVYDCGSGSNPNPCKVLTQEIYSYYREEDEIDILFISHFDNDHINGISKLRNRVSKIKNIVVPLIEERDYWFYNLENPEFQVFYGSLEDMADHVLKISSQIEADYVEGFDELPHLDLSEIENSLRKVRIIDSATKLRLTSKCDWCYIPFNYDKEVRKNKLLDCLSSQEIDVDVFNHGVSGIEDNMKAIKAAYEGILDKDSANKTSLILYSGGCADYYHGFQYQTSNLNYRHNRISCEGCLYFGDTDLNQYHILRDLQCKLDYVIDRVGTIQIPHHGALKNFNNDILDAFYSSDSYFVSFAKNNSYGHPSFRVLAEVLVLRRNVYQITSSRDSAYIQVFYRHP